VSDHRRATDVRVDARGDYLVDLLRTPFTREQLAVATAPLSPQLVVAGAGSGKTTVMAARVVHAVAFHQVPPDAVLGLTFTNKAAGQLADGVRSALRRLHLGAPVGDATVDDSPTVATYHSYAAGIVRDHALRIGREPVTTLLTEAGRWQLAMRVVRRAVGPFAAIRWQPPTVAGYLLDLDGELSEHLCSLDDVREFDAGFVDVLDALPSLTNALRECGAAAQARDELLGLVETYRAEKARLDLIDYGDQVALAATIARNAPEVAQLERDRYRLVLLDEYQDTGVSQRVLLSELFGAGHAVTAVGDPNQSIYGWRGASVGNLLRFLDHFGGSGRAQPLMTSFRCGATILAVANAVSEPLRGTATTSRTQPAVEVPELTAAPGREGTGRVVASLHERADQESGWVAERIAAVLAADEALTPGHVAVLCRRRSDFPMLHRELVARDVPVEVVGLGGLLEMPEVADVVAVLRVLVEPTANPAMLRLLTGPRWRIGVRDLAALGRRARSLAWTGRPDSDVDSTEVDAALRVATESVDAVDVPALSDVLDTVHEGADDLSPAAVSRLLRLRHELDELRGVLGQPIVEIAAEVARRTGLSVELEVEPSRVAQARVGNLAAFLDHAASFSGIEGENDLISFLGWLDAAVAAESGLDVGGVSDADSVKLLTVHKAKGLEWDVVAVPGLTSTVFPSSRGRSRWTSGAAVLPFPCRGDSDDLPPSPTLTSKGLDAFKAACKADDADEERRLGYVAFTRARSLLLASGYWWGRTQRKPMGPSSLLQELHALAGGGLVEIDTWCAEPESVTNPLAAESNADVAWPAEHDAASRRRREDAAALVRDAAATAGQPSGREQLSDAEQADVSRWDDEARLLVDELRRSDEAVREVALPARLTASQVVALAHDPSAFAASLARPVPTRPQPQARRGSRFHLWVEQLHGSTPLLSPDDLPGAGEALVTDEELADLQRRFLAGEWGERRPVAMESPFELVVGGRLVRGRIDAVYRDDDGEGYDVIDYKTGAVPRDVESASLQLSVYRLAWADLAGVDPSAVRAGFLYVRTGQLLRPERLLDRDQLGALLTG
jgi:DNA helicase-2/ATP-dependent DNA helicase PcrA